MRHAVRGAPTRRSTAELARIRKSNFEDSQKKFDAFLKEREASRSPTRATSCKVSLQQTGALQPRDPRRPLHRRRREEVLRRQPGPVQGRRRPHASHILVPTKAEADKIRAEVTPENFAELAKENSTDTAPRTRAASLGQIQKGQLVPEFEKVAFALKSGEISAPVKTQFGWHIITVNDHAGPHHAVRRGQGPDHLQPARREAPGDVRDWSARRSRAGRRAPPTRTTT